MGESRRRKMAGEITPKQARVRQFGEVFTPIALVDRVLDKLPADSWTDPTKTFCEPCVGNGNFIAGILPRLMAGLASFEPNPVKLHKWIFERMLHAVDIQPHLIEECIHRFNLYDVRHHFVCADALSYPMQFNEWQVIDACNIKDVNFFHHIKQTELDKLDFTDTTSKFIALPQNCIMARKISPL